MTEYAGYWQPQSLPHAQFLIDTEAGGEAFWQRGKHAADWLCTLLPAMAYVIVDYGCGVGRVLQHMPGSRRIGIDVSAEMLAYARTACCGCEFIQGDGRSIPLPDGSVDFVYSLLTLQHMDAEDVVAVVADVARVLNRGGRCLLEFSTFGPAWAPHARINRDGESSWTGERSGSWSSAHGALAYTPDVVRQITAAAGLQKISMTSKVISPASGYLEYLGERACTTC